MLVDGADAVAGAVQAAAAAPGVIDHDAVHLRPEPGVEQDLVRLAGIQTPDGMMKEKNPDGLFEERHRKYPTRFNLWVSSPDVKCGAPGSGSGIFSLPDRL